MPGSCVGRRAVDTSWDMPKWAAWEEGRSRVEGDS